MNRKRGHQKKDDGRVWDSLKSVSDRTGGLLAIAGPIGNLASEVYAARSSKPAWLAYFNMPDFVTKAVQLEADLKRYKCEYEAIKKQHENKSGVEENPDEWLRAIQINEQYLSWSERFNNGIIPLFEKMTDMLITAQKKAAQTPTAPEQTTATNVE